MILTQAQVLNLVERSISQDPNIAPSKSELELAFKIADAITGAKANTNTPAGTFAQYLSQIDNPSGTPYSKVTTDGTTISISPNAQAILNSGTFGEDNSSFKFATKTKILLVQQAYDGWSERNPSRFL
jgi:hypothetical protein